MLQIAHAVQLRPFSAVTLGALLVSLQIHIYNHAILQVQQVSHILYELLVPLFLIVLTTLPMLCYAMRLGLDGGE